MSFDLTGVEEKELVFKVKILTGEDIEKKAAEFEKTHKVWEIKQYVENIMFIFYTE